MKDAAVLALNAGSSSLKFAVFDARRGGDEAALLHGELDGIGGIPAFSATDRSGAKLAGPAWNASAKPSYDALLDDLLGWIEAQAPGGELVAAGHRIVHGGRAFIRPTLLDGDVLQALEALTPLAPLHQPHSLAPVRAIMKARPGLRQVACFDTAFHHTMPLVATRLALPHAYEDEGVRRYGFHGLSYEFIARRLRQTLPALAGGRVIVAHLGNGASLCAMRDGRSVDTTMGFTALDGLVMGTRCGTIDPGVLLYLLQQKGLAASELEQLLYNRSGLLGVSGVSSDMRALLASAEPRAQAAVELFVFRVAREAGALAASLGGIDGFIFTGGIGQHATQIQDAVCERLRWLGVAQGERQQGTSRISAPGSRVDVHVVATDEEAMICQHTLDALTA